MDSFLRCFCALHGLDGPIRVTPMKAHRPGNTTGFQKRLVNTNPTDYSRVRVHIDRRL
jgi:hypothetical protein